jgi:hypothetical protein
LANVMRKFGRPQANSHLTQTLTQFPGGQGVPEAQVRARHQGPGA